MFAVCVALVAAAPALAQSGIDVHVSPRSSHQQPYEPWSSHQPYEPRSSQQPYEPRSSQQPYEPSLQKQVKDAHEDATLLYTTYTARSKAEYRNFMQNVTDLYQRTAMDVRGDGSDDRCLQFLSLSLRKAQRKSMKAALFNGEIHHKYFKGHMIVFRMHLNRSEEYAEKYDRAINCGDVCNIAPRNHIERWRRVATTELQRFREDYKFTARSYRDIYNHGRKFLIHLRKEANLLVKKAMQEYHDCHRGV